MSSNAYVFVETDSEDDAVKEAFDWLNNLPNCEAVWTGNPRQEFVLHAAKRVWRVDVVYKIVRQKSDISVPQK